MVVRKAGSGGSDEETSEQAPVENEETLREPARSGQMLRDSGVRISFHTPSLTRRKDRGSILIMGEEQRC